MVAQNICRCECGYSCDKKCGLPILECIQKHYTRDCDHKWDGPMKHFANVVTVTCSICEMSALEHDMAYGV
jgi:hypothetical protein